MITGSNPTVAPYIPLNSNIWEAALNGNNEDVKHFIRTGVNVNNNTVNTYDGKAPLHLAAEKGHLNVVRTLVQIGKANVNIMAGSKNGGELQIKILEH